MATGAGVAAGRGGQGCRVGSVTGVGVITWTDPPIGGAGAAIAGVAESQPGR